MYLVIENTPGYLPDEEPAEFYEYSDAVQYLLNRANEYTEDEHYRVENWASRDNFLAVMIYDEYPGGVARLPRWIEIVRGDEGDEGDGGDDS
jgi:hypothetical protein